MARKRRRRRRKNPAGIPTWLLIASGIGAFIYFKKQKEENGEAKVAAKVAVEEAKAQAAQQGQGDYLTIG